LRLVLNSKSTIIVDDEKGKRYLRVMDGWMEAPDLEGPWTYTSEIPDDMKEITKGIQERQKASVQEGTNPPSLKDAKKEGKLPVIYVSFGPAELLVTEGPPQYEAILEAGLEYVKNTTASIFRDPDTSDYHILLAG